jgi:hypothetical protein
MFQLTEETFKEIKYELEVLISECSDKRRTMVPASELTDLLLDVYSKFIQIKENNKI